MKHPIPRADDNDYKSQRTALDQAAGLLGITVIACVAAIALAGAAAAYWLF